MRLTLKMQLVLETWRYFEENDCVIKSLDRISAKIRHPPFCYDLKINQYTRTTPNGTLYVFILAYCHIYIQCCALITLSIFFLLQWRHNGRDRVSNHQPLDCFLSCLSRHRSKKMSKLRVTGLCAGNSLEAGEFPGQMASNAENVSIWWRHHANPHNRRPIAHLWDQTIGCLLWFAPRIEVLHQ